MIQKHKSSSARKSLTMFHRSSSYTDWSRWLNTHRPQAGGDYECLSCLRQRGYRICEKTKILTTECRSLNTGVTFTESTHYKIRDKLRTPCTNSGLLCVDSDQVTNKSCDDYAIRYKCAADNSVLGSMYWWIGILTGIFVLVALIWFIFYIISRRRNGSLSCNDDETRDSALAQPPPSYKDLFGSDASRENGVRNASSSQENLVTNEDLSLPQGIVSPVFSADCETTESEPIELNTQTQSNSTPSLSNTPLQCGSDTITQTADINNHDSEGMSHQVSELREENSSDTRRVDSPALNISMNPDPFSRQTNRRPLLINLHRSPFSDNGSPDEPPPPAYDDAVRHLYGMHKSRCI